MNNLQIFSSEEFGEIRTVIIDGEPWFCMTDICKALEISNTSQAKTRLNADGVITNEVIDSIGRKQNANFVNEPNMYKLIFQSRKESAERFTDWVTSEVLPSIRKTGSYQKPMTLEEQLQIVAKGTLEVKEEIRKVNEDLQEFKKDMPLLALECQKITKAKNQKVVPMLGGKDAPAYKDNSLRQLVYSDIDAQLRREFGVNTYKAIKRNQCDLAVKIINEYELPMYLKDQIDSSNAQISFGMN
jgi:prophage antirepressor-like protein